MAFRYSGLLAMAALAGCQASPGALTTASKADVAGARAPVATRLIASSARDHVVAGVVRIDSAYALAAGASKLVNGTLAALQPDGSLAPTPLDASFAIAPASIVATNASRQVVLDDSGPTNHLYALLDANAGVAGALLPAAGMAVYMRSPETGKLLAIGRDPSGAPAYAVYTNARGEYKLYASDTLPPTLQVEACVPGRPDERLRYGCLVDSTDTRAVTIDEASAIALRYTEQVGVAKLRAMLADDPASLGATLRLENYPAAVVARLKPGLDKFLAAVERGKTRALPAEQQTELATRFASQLIAATRLGEAVPLDAHGEPMARPADVSQRDCLSALAEIVEGDRQAVAARMQALSASQQDPGPAFEALDEVQRLDALDHKRYRIRRASDLVDFFVIGYYARAGLAPLALAAGRDKLGQEAGLPATKGGTAWREAILNGMTLQILDVLFDVEGATLASMVSQLEAAASPP